MCGGHSAEELTTIGQINSLGKSDWIDLADELTRLTDEEFTLLMNAFREYRRHRIARKKLEAQLTLPKRARSHIKEKFSTR